jgi:hypothetical protein
VTIDHPRWCVAAVVAVLGGALVGCASMVDGTATVGANRAPLPSSGPEVKTSKLNDLLLGLDDVEALVGGRDMVVDERYSDMPQVGEVTYKPADCVGAAFNTIEPAYRGSGYIAVRGQLLKEPGDQFQHWVDQGVVAFGSAADADNYVVTATEVWRKCSHQFFSVIYPKEPTETWEIGSMRVSGGVATVSKYAEGGDGWSCSHAMAAKSNVVVDLAACSMAVTDQATKLVDEIEGRFPQ